jgi:hypothetical protein
MSRDLKQAASDFNRNLCLVALYSEYSSEGLTRYLFWRPPQGSLFEVRSGRTLERFREFDEMNIERGWALLSLHINENKMHSAVWISTPHYECAVEILDDYGITPARREPPGEDNGKGMKPTPQPSPESPSASGSLSGTS